MITTKDSLSIGTRPLEPFDLEANLLRLKCVLDCAVLVGEVPEIFVVPRIDSSLSETRSKVVDFLGPWAHALTLIRSIPRTEDGAADLDRLRELDTVREDSAAAVRWEPVRLPPPTRMIEDLDGDVEFEMTPAEKPTSSKVSLGSGPALVRGPRLAIRDDDPRTVTEAILTRGRRSTLGVIALEPAGPRFLSYTELLEHGLRVLGGLHERGLTTGSRVVLSTSSLSDYFVAVWACLLGGIQFVTVDASRAMEAWSQLDRPLVVGASPVTDSETCPTVVTVTELAVSEPAVPSPTNADDVAALVMSSGSTGTPKLIQVTHRAVVENALSARQVDMIRPGETSFNWLPFDHAPPLVMYLLRDVVLDCLGVHTTTENIVREPGRWLDIIERYGVNHTWSANFGYRLLTETIRANPQRTWSVEPLRTMLNAGEQCTPAVVRDFLSAAERVGITERTMIHMWGMAETATGASSKYLADPGSIKSGEGTEFVSMGAPTPGSELRIVDESTAVVDQGTVGRLQTRGNRVTPGYVGNVAAQANADSFTVDGWFDTGDLAFIEDGELVITGRAKEVIVVNGEKYYCHTIEDVVNTVAGVRTGFAAACGVPDASTGTERLVVFYVQDEAIDRSGAQLESDTRKTVSAALRVHVDEMVRIDSAHFPKTSGGKIQRSNLVRQHLDGRFARSVPDCVFTVSWQPIKPVVASYGGPLRTLVFADDRGLADKMNWGSGDVLVRRGDTSPSWWTRLRQNLNRRAWEPDRIVYLWSYLNSSTPTRSDAVLDAMAAATRDLVSALRTFDDIDYDLVTVSGGLRNIDGTESVSFPAAGAATITAVRGREHPDLISVHLDVAGHSVVADAADLTAGLTDRSLTYRDIAWRAGVPHIRRITAATSVHERRNALVRGGRYVVTGGSGGVGTTLIPDLVSRYSLSLLVLGRSGQGPDLDGVEYRSVDVRDGNAVEKAVREAESRWGAAMTGYLHLADTYRMRRLSDEDPSDWEPTDNTKAAGSLVAADVVRRRPGAELVLFTSLLGQFGTAGCAAYGVGNAIADALVDRLVGVDNVPARSLSWSMWSGTGINADNPYENLAAGRGVVALPPVDASRIAREGLRRPAGTYLVGIDPHGSDFRSFVAVGPDDELVLDRPVPDNSAPVDGAPEVYDAVLDAITAFAATSTGVITSETALQDLGLTSVRMVRVVARLEANLGRDVSAHVFFDEPTVGSLVRALTSDGRR